MKNNKIAPENWLETKLGEYADEQLCELMREIVRLKRNGELAPNSQLRKLENKIAEYVQSPGGSMLEVAKYAVLFEMSRRYYNGHVTSEED